MTRLRAWAVCGLTILNTACAPEPSEIPPPDFELETKWFVLRGYGTAQEQICGGTIHWMDDYMDTLSVPLDLAPVELGAYHWYSDEAWADGFCGSAEACVRTHHGVETVFSRPLPHEHELVHLIANHGAESCVWVLSEGLAEHLQGPYPPTSGSLEGSSIEQALAVSFGGADVDGSTYHRARHFVSFLVFEFGLETIFDLCESSPWGITREEFSDAATEVVGASLDELLIAYLDYPACAAEQDRAKLFECSREPVLEVGSGDEVSLDLDVSCAHHDAVGPRGDRFHVSSQIRILESGDYSWRLANPEPPFSLFGAAVLLEQCASCGDGAVGFHVEWDPNFIPTPHWLPAGDYAVEVQLPLEFSGPVEVRFEG